MDEQRMQAYLKLIEQLLGCAQGQEAELLQANAELVDTRLLEVMVQVAEQLVSQGNNNAEWLQEFGRQLTQSLGIVTPKTTGIGDTERFLRETLQLVVDSKSNPQQVYPVWAQQQERLNAELLAVMPQTMTQLFAGKTEQRTFIASTLCSFGNLINQFPWGTRWLNLELGITAYELALQVYTQDIFPEQWAMTQNNLANAYKNRIQGDRSENLEQAIAAYKLALQVYTREALPEQWATTQNNLANAYKSRIQGDRSENLEQAIHTYELALQVYTCESFPEEWAMTQNNLANAYSIRIRGDRAKNLEQAITAYNLALQVRTHEAFPEQWAATQSNLANAYTDRIRGDRAENLEQAINAYNLALQVRTRSAYPKDWSETQNNLAAAYTARIQGDRAGNLEQAIFAYELALQVRTYETYPEDWAGTENNLAAAYTARIRGDRAENLEQAIASSKLALQVYTRESFPEQWAATQNSLANAYNSRIRGDRAENLEQAITAYNLALQVYTREALPEQWAMTQNNLAASYTDRIRGDRAENLEQAIAAYNLALQVRTRESFPEQWAMTQNNLANTYRNRIRGNRAENLEQAIALYNLALQVRTREAFPKDWAMTQNNLAASYTDHIRGDRAENLEQAISAYNLALQVITREAFPEDWAGMQYNLAAAYRKRTQGDRSENLEQAIAFYNLALQVRTHEAFPEQWAATQNNLANVYWQHIRGNHADNLAKAITAYESALKVYTYEAFPNECRRTSRNLATLYFEQSNWESSSDAYTNALSATEMLYQSCILLESKIAELAETGELQHCAAYALARINKIPKAITTLERVRARGLSETLDRDRANLDKLKKQDENLYTQYKEITQQLRNLEAQQRDRMTSDDRHSITPESLRNKANSLRQELTTTLDQIRQLPGNEAFLTLPSFEDVQQAATHCPLVYLVTTPAGSLALIVTPDSTNHLWLDDFTDTHLTELLNNTWFNTYQKWVNASQKFKANASEENLLAYKQAEDDWFDAIDTTTHQLWKPLIGQLVQRLTELDLARITLIPTGYLSLLPLHAAWTDDARKPAGRRYALDDIHITYAPNAKSLTAAQSIADRVQTDSILAIDNPQQDLPNSEREINCAIATFPQPNILRHEKATIASVKDGLMGAAIAHFSCHGTANLKEPLSSGLAMSDGLLTLKDIFALNLAESGGIRLAILSACETGIQGIENADEAISLPTGLLQAGVAAVIASLWSVSDLSTMMLLARFYDLWRNDGSSPSVALRQAQKWVRDTTNQEKYDYLKNHFQSLTHTQRISEQEVNNLLRDFMIQYIYQDGPESRSFAHPFHWAAFSYVGV
jgi:CHAT domain-containing protein/tetratricopeptide (TPR) repeat protein